MIKINPFTKFKNNCRGLIFHIDHLVYSNNLIYGWGWLFNKKKSILKIQLVLNIDNEYHYLPCTCGISRPDVKKDHADCNLYCGFKISCTRPKGNIVESTLEVEYEDSTKNLIDISNHKSTSLIARITSLIARIRGIFIPVTFINAFKYILQGDYRKLFYGIKAIIINLQNANIDENAQQLDYENIQQFDESYVSEKIKDDEQSILKLVIDHNLGGGATLYRDKWIEAELGMGNKLLLLYYDLFTLSYYIKIYTNDSEELFSLESIENIVDIIINLKPQEIMLNNTVSYYEPLFIATIIPIIKQEINAKIIIPIHDYFLICPSFTLLDSNGRFCRIPNIDHCRKCLQKYQDSYTHLVNCTDIILWRNTWSTCLKSTDIIYCFSNSSKELLLQAYPELDSSKIQVRPHSVNYMKNQQVSLKYDDNLHIGIVGYISKQKGSDIIKQMVDIIEKSQLPVRITLIGEFEEGIISPIINITGPYKREQLPELIESSGANVFFLPSICPETFSYIAEELMILNVPLAVFDIGAPAERVAKYNKGIIIKNIDAEHALDMLTKFHKDLQESIKEKTLLS